jgi:ABC-type transporter Mla subunit MlaD
MKRERGDLMVGAVVLLAIVVMLGAALWIIPTWADRTYPLFAEFSNVDGIGDRAPVQLQGYRVGYVDGIAPRVTPEGVLVFRVRMEIDRGLTSREMFELPVGTRALITPPPLPIGAGVIVLDLPAPGNPPLQPGAIIAGARAPVALDQFQAMASNLDSQLTATVASARTLMDSLTLTTASVNRTVASTQAALPGLLEGFRMQLAATQALTGDVRANLNTITPAAIAGIDSATALLADSRVAVQEVTSMVQRSEANIAGILANLDTTTVMVQTLVGQFSDRPLWVLLTGARREP